MGATFVITLREAFEAVAACSGIVYTYLDKIDARAQASRYVEPSGGALGLLASVAMGVARQLPLRARSLDLGP